MDVKMNLSRPLSTVQTRLLARQMLTAPTNEWEQEFVKRCVQRSVLSFAQRRYLQALVHQYLEGMPPMTLRRQLHFGLVRAERYAGGYGIWVGHQLCGDSVTGRDAEAVVGWLVGALAEIAVALGTIKQDQLPAPVDEKPAAVEEETKP